MIYCCGLCEYNFTNDCHHNIILYYTTDINFGLHKNLTFLRPHRIPYKLSINFKSRVQELRVVRGQLGQHLEVTSVAFALLYGAFIATIVYNDT